MEEMIEVLDENGNGTGIIKAKKEIKRDGDFHRAISICIVNDNKEILMHKRSIKKLIFPNLWSCFIRGHVQAYEESINACIRELEEEIGIRVTPNDLQFLYTSKDNNNPSNTKYINNIFFDNYILRMNIDINNLKLDEEEVSETEYISYKDLKLKIESNDKELIPNFDDYEKIIQLLEKAS